MVEVKVKGLISSDTGKDSSALVLQEVGGDRQLLIVVSDIAAKPIYRILKHIEEPVPSMHDVFETYLNDTNSIVKYVAIKHFEHGVFYSDILIDRLDQHYTLVLNIRTSDAIVMALKFNAPIGCVDTVFEELSVSSKYDDSEMNAVSSEEEDDYMEWMSKQVHKFTIDELEEALKQAVKDEDYQLASLYRDERNKRKNK